MASRSSSPSRPWPTHRLFPIQYHDIDVLNHLNHAAYFPFMETLRCDYYLNLLGTTDPSAIDIILAEAACRFRAPVGYGQELFGEVVPALPLGTTSFTLLYRFRSPDGETLYAQGRTVQVCFDYRKNVKKEIPAARRATMEKDGISPADAGWT